jgi:hypothetical protein
MMIYPRDDERAIRVQGMVEDWAKSGLLQKEQRDRMQADLQVDYRRTNRFLRATLFFFGFLILNAVVGLVAVLVDEEDVLRVIAFLAAGGAFFLAQTLIARFRPYRFGIEEAAAVASVVFFAAGCTVFVGHGFSSFRMFIALAGGSFIVFARFGYLYAGIAAVLFAGVIPLNYDYSPADTTRRLSAIVILFLIFGLARERRKDHEWEFPGDLYGAIEATAWAALYLVTNLKASQWLLYTDPVPLFYWATYAGIWILPAAGLYLAIRDRHRWMLDANIVMAIVTLMTNKPYLNGMQKPWDPILFGVLMIAIALGLKRWLASGAGGSRSGFIAERLLASERERLGIASSATALAPGAPVPHSHPAPASPGIGGGGSSGGAGASGKF